MSQPTMIQVEKTRDLPPTVVPHRAKNIRAAKGVGRGFAKLVKVGIKHRKKLAPIYAAAGLTTLGSVLSTSSNGAATAGAIDAAGAVALVWWMRRRAASKRALRRNELIWALVNSGGAAALLMTMALMSPLTPPVPGLAALWFLATAGPYWWKRRIRPTSPLNVDLDERIERWQERVAAQGKALPDAFLVDVENLANGYGWKATIKLPAGQVTVDQAISATAKIAGAYHLPLASVSIERMPDGAEHHAALTVYTVNPLQKIHPWPGPETLDESTGLARIGVYADGDPVMYRFWRNGSGPVHDLISGDTDGGKSRLLDLLLAMEKQSTLIHSWVIDPQGGQSLPDWQDDVGWFADSAEEGITLLMAAVRVMYHRSAILSRTEWTDDNGVKRRGFKGFTPGMLGMPLLSITIDEAHAVLRNPIAVMLCQEIAKMGRKCGVRLRLVTQMPLLDQLGNSNVLRAQVASGNVIVLRTSAAISGQVAFQSSFAVHPHKLPREWPDGSTTSGLGYALGPSARPSVMRSLFIEDPIQWAKSGPDVPLEDEAIKAAGEPFQTWRERREERWSMPVAAPAFAMEDLEPSGQATSAQQTPAGRTAASGTYKQAILGYLHGLDSDEFAYTGAIAKAVNAPLQTTSTTLARLEAEGSITKLARGKWALKQDEAAAVAA